MWFLIGMVLGGTIGVMLAAIVTVGKVGDLESENAVLRARLWAFTQEEQHG